MCPKSSEVINVQCGFNFLRLNLNSAHHLVTSIKTDFFPPLSGQLIESQSKALAWHLTTPKALHSFGNVLFLQKKLTRGMIFANLWLWDWCVCNWVGGSTFLLGHVSYILIIQSRVYARPKHEPKPNTSYQEGEEYIMEDVTSFAVTWI